MPLASVAEVGGLPPAGFVEFRSGDGVSLFGFSWLRGDDGVALPVGADFGSLRVADPNGAIGVLASTFDPFEVGQKLEGFGFDVKQIQRVVVADQEFGGRSQWEQIMTGW